MRSTRRPSTLLSAAVGALLLLIAGGAWSPAAQAQPPACADLVITNYSVQPLETSRIVEDSPVEVEVTVRNQGTCDSLSYTVQWDQDNGGLLSQPAGPATHDASGLANGQSATFSFEYTYPESGDFLTVLTVDSGDTVIETNEDNNVAIQGVKVWENKPDLVVTSFSVSPAVPAKNRPATISVGIYNEGTADAGPFVVQWNYDDDRFVPPGPAKQVGGLSAGGITTVFFTYAFPEARDYNTVVHLDTDNTVDEWNETNNMAIFPVTVIETAPDLVITDFQITPVNPAANFPQDQPVAGLNALIEITVKNQGADPAGGFVVQWKSAVRAPTGPSETVTGLAAGESKTVRFEYAFPDPGNFTTVATVDTDDDVDETNESNNLQIKAVTVQVPVVDLIITQFTVKPAPGVITSIPPQVVEDRLAKVTIVVENVGNFPSGDYTIVWRPRPFVPPLSMQMPGLGYDQSATALFDFTYVDPGSYRTTAIVDQPNRVVESNEDNNTRSFNLIVEPALPDLVIQSIVLSPANPVQGTSAQATVTVFNRGNSPAGPFQVQYRPAPLAPPLSKQVNGLGVLTTALRTAVLTFDYTYGFPGTFVATATADVTDQVAEINENNNSRPIDVVVLASSYDLLVTGVSVGQGSCFEVDGEARQLQEPILEQNAAYNFCVTIENTGNSAIDSFVVSLDPDARNLIIPSLDTLTQQVDSIPAESSMVLEFPVVYPEDGGFQVNALVDAFDTIRENNEDNNLFIYNVVVEPTGPNLVISELTIGDDFRFDDLAGVRVTDGQTPPEGFRQSECFGEYWYPEDGIDTTRAVADHSIPPYVFLIEPRLLEDNPTPICIEVTNIGNRSSTPSMLQWNADANGLITNGTTTLGEQVPSLEPGESWLVVFNFAWTEVGTFHTVAKADAFDDVAELDEEDNLAIADVVVDPDKPDLVITDLDISIFPACSGQDGPFARAAAQNEPIVVQGNRIFACIDIYNNGGVAAEAFSVAWNPDETNLTVPSDQTLSQEISRLGPFQSATVVFEFEYNEYGTFSTVAQVDFFDSVEELIESNNKRLQSVIVNPGNVNLYISSFTVTPNPVDRGSKLTANIQVCNSGNYPSGPFFVEWQPRGADTVGMRQRVDGLNEAGEANQCQTVSMDSSIAVADNYLSVATVDATDIEIETNEGDNTATRNINVQPRVTRITLDFTNMKVKEAFEDGINGEGEWDQGFIVIDPNATNACNIDLNTGGVFDTFPDIEINEDGLRCGEGNKNDLEDGDNYDPNVSFTFDLIESFPIFLVSLGIQDGSEIEFPDFTGVALQLWTVNDYLNVGSDTIPGQQGSCGGGNCFDLTYNISIVSKPAPFYRGAARAEEIGPLPTPTVVLNEAMARSLPKGTTLPEGVQWPDGWDPNSGFPQGTSQPNKLMIPFIIR